MPRLPLQQTTGKKISSQDAPQNQWVMITEEKIFDNYGNDMDNISMHKLRHPKTDKATFYLISNGGQQISEIMKFESSCGSWLIGDSVQKDGSILMTTPVDPLFLVLPYLINAAKSGKYMTVDQIVHDEEFPDVSNLLACLDFDSLDYVADMKGAGDFKAYRYNSEKTLSWLRLKTDNVLEALRSSGVDMNESGAQSALFIRSKKTSSGDENGYLKYACGLVSDYIPLELVTSLKDYLGITEAVEDRSPVEPPNKKVKLSENQGTVTPTEDYSRFFGQDSKKQTSAAGGRQTAAQKKLSKVDVRGMKSISSFFSSKS
ncbi:hypothetical protein C0Q70_21489 [Pomacea canaliculata]|uniref:Ribonuclease H2 subunit B n=1 Tax=Pomacea canaliculata TaxID=400727 RepID=A0A2T7NCN4_POMCA|nr:ribonuclease H2 subunit B-like [Pomacea canaliculata]PVD18930.1 hypothetical protein C0Q70_21489 [Pomacea canaliculata]